MIAILRAWHRARKLLKPFGGPAKEKIPPKIRRWPKMTMIVVFCGFVIVLLAPNPGWEICVFVFVIFRSLGFKGVFGLCIRPAGSLIYVWSHNVAHVDDKHFGSIDWPCLLGRRPRNRLQGQTLSICKRVRRRVRLNRTRTPTRRCPINYLLEN